MTNLRVFENASGEIFVELSSPFLELSQALLAPAVANPEDLRDVNEGEYVRVVFREGWLFVLYMAVRSRDRSDLGTRLKLIGALAETDSINVLNHLLDILAYP